MSTGYVFEDIYLRHDLPGHPENAQRLTAIMAYLQEQALLPRLVRIPARSASLDELTRCHHARHIERVEEVSLRGGGHLDPDTYVNVYSYEAALQAAGGVIELTTAVLDGRLQNGFALVRPPGHHAVPARAMGFCLFGNVAIAARAAQQLAGVERVAIVDFDVHHGNGTQDIFYEDPMVLFVSSHQYPFYPGTGGLKEIGTGAATGITVNLPLSPGVGDVGFQQLYGEVVFPLIRRFQPQLILISAGFDAHWDDPLANLGLTLTGYFWLCQQLIALAAEVCQGRIVFTLEGGYNLLALAPGAGNVFRALLGETRGDDPLGPSPWPDTDVAALVSQLKQLHSLT
jgi:acetoin utilization deacetylase AcuC-like enzyme